jgi:hypothetical protein
MASEIKVDTVSEKTSGSGVTIDGLLIKDGGISGDVSLIGTTPTFTIGDAGAEDAALVFDGNAQDFYIALDDSADDLLIGLGSTVGTTPAVSIDENLQVKIVATTASTSATTGSFIAAGGAGIAADLHVGDDVTLISDSAVLGFGADKDTTLTHTDGTGLTLNSTNKLCFNDTGTYVGSNADGDIDIVSDGTAIDSINIESAGGITLDAGSTTHGITYEDDGTAMLQITNSSSDVIIKPLVDAKDIIFQQYDGTAVLTIEDNATANIPAGKLAIGGTAVTATAAELNLLDGGTSVGSSITLADADGVVVNDGGTMKTIPASDFTTYIAGNLVQVKTATISGGNPAGVNLISAFSTDYGVYVMTIRKMEATVDSASLSIRMRDANGARSGSTYKYSNRNWDDDGNEENVSANSADTKYQFTNDTDDSTDDGGYNAVWYIFDPADANTSTRIQAFGSYLNGDVSDIKSHIGAMHFTTAEAHNGIGFDITSGGYRDGAVITIYGVKGS